MNDPVRRIPWPPPDRDTPDALVTREWLVANALGGYSSGTVAGVTTRRYHGLLIAALPGAHGRTVMLTHVAEQVRSADGGRFEIGGRERTNEAPDAQGAGYLAEFRLELGLPVWHYDVDGLVIERRVFMANMQNTVYLMYELLGGADRVELALRPSVNFRAQELPVSEPLASPYELRAVGDHVEIALPGAGLPPLRMRVAAGDSIFAIEGKRIDNVLYPVEESRGYQAKGDLWSPGYFRFTLETGHPATLVASTEQAETMGALEPEQALEAERGRRRRLLAQAVPEAQDGVPADL